MILDRCASRPTCPCAWQKTGSVKSPSPSNLGQLASLGHTGPQHTKNCTLPVFTTKVWRTALTNKSPEKASPSKASLGTDGSQELQGHAGRAKFGCLGSEDGMAELKEGSSFRVTGQGTMWSRPSLSLSYLPIPGPAERGCTAWNLLCFPTMANSDTEVSKTKCIVVWHLRF